MVINIARKFNQAGRFVKRTASKAKHWANKQNVGRKIVNTARATKRTLNQINNAQMKYAPLVAAAVGPELAPAVMAASATMSTANLGVQEAYKAAKPAIKHQRAVDARSRARKSASRHRKASRK